MGFYTIEQNLLHFTLGKKEKEKKNFFQEIQEQR